MAPYIDAWFALSLVIFGLSHAAQPRLWADFFNAPTSLELKRQGISGVGVVPESHYVANADLFTATSMDAGRSTGSSSTSMGRSGRSNGSPDSAAVP